MILVDIDNTIFHKGTNAPISPKVRTVLNDLKIRHNALIYYVTGRILDPSYAIIKADLPMDKVIYRGMNILNVLRPNAHHKWHTLMFLKALGANVVLGIDDNPKVITMYGYNDIPAIRITGPETWDEVIKQETGLGDVAIQMPEQSTAYSCGVSAMMAVLRHYGKAVSEQDLFKLLNCRPLIGTTSGDMYRVAMQYGLNPEISQLKVKEVQDLTDKNIPVIMLIQSRNGNGHYVVAVGYDKEGILVNDPLDDNIRTRITYANLPNVWWDCDIGGKLHRYNGIVIRN